MKNLPAITRNSTPRKTDQRSPHVRRNRKSSLALAGSIAALLAVQAAHAATITWNAGTAVSTDGLWSTATNWTADTAPGDGSDLVFGGTAFQTNSNNIPLSSLGSLTLNNAGWAITLGTVTLNAGGLVANGTSTVGGTITLGAAQTWSNSAGLLTVTGTVSKSGNLLTIGGAGDTAISAVIGGVGGLTKQDAGTLTLTGANTYSGSTTLGSGILNANSTNALGDSSATNTLMGTSINPYFPTPSFAYCGSYDC